MLLVLLHVCYFTIQDFNGHYFLIRIWDGSLISFHVNVFFKKMYLNGQIF